MNRIESAARYMQEAITGQSVVDGNTAQTAAWHNLPLELPEGTRARLLIGKEDRPRHAGSIVLEAPHIASVNKLHRGASSGFGTATWNLEIPERRALILGQRDAFGDDTTGEEKAYYAERVEELDKVIAQDFLTGHEKQLQRYGIKPADVQLVRLGTLVSSWRDKVIDIAVKPELRPSAEKEWVEEALSGSHTATIIDLGRIAAERSSRDDAEVSPKSIHPTKPGTTLEPSTDDPRTTIVPYSSNYEEFKSFDGAVDYEEDWANHPMFHEHKDAGADTDTKDLSQGTPGVVFDNGNNTQTLNDIQNSDVEDNEPGEPDQDPGYGYER